MSKQAPKNLSGFMELLPQQQLRFDRMLNVLKDTFSVYGFSPIDTSPVQQSEVLLAKGGGETEKQVYRFQKGDSDLCLRFDLTVPLAKYVAQHYNELCFPFRCFQAGKSYRGERAQRGRFREFMQVDIDIIGDGALSSANEAEIPSIIYNAFSRLGLSRFKVRVNNRKLLNGFYRVLGIFDNSIEVMRTVDKIEKIGAEKVAGILTGELGIPESAARGLLDFISISGSNADVLAGLAAYEGKDDLYDAGLAELRTAAGYLAQFGVPEQNFAIDLTIARGLDYYTGTVYETTLLDYPEIGSVCSGGRYDDLAGLYCDQKLPGVGISIGLTRLFYVLSEQGLVNGDISVAPCGVLVIPMTGDYSVAVEFATLLRSRGISTQIYFEQKKFKQKLGYADRLGAPFAAIIGEDEIAGNTVSCKNMVTGEQVTLPQAAAADLIAAGLEKLPRSPLIKETAAL